MRQFTALFLLLLTSLGTVSAALAADESQRPPLPARPVPTVTMPLRPSPQTLRDELSRILAKPEYQPAEMTWLQHIYEKIGKAVSWLLRQLRAETALGRLLETSPLLYWTIVASLIVVLGLLLYHIYRAIGLAFGPQRKPSLKGTLPPLPLTSPRQLRDRAQEAARRGDFEQALRYLYIALLRQLDRSGVLTFQRGRTNWEYIEDLRGEASILTDFCPLTLALERVVYGRVPASAEVYTESLERVERLWTQERGANG